MVFAGTGVWKSKRGTPLLGCRCVFINDEQYGYNVRNELISADEVSYNYDDIGNRTTAEGKTYTANNLNQYTAIDDFVPQYDDDGNQTLVKTETGVWSVTYNAENRPIRWQSGDTVITMAFDRMGRRVEMCTVTPDADLLQRFVYKDFLCVQQFRGSTREPYQTYVWDPTEPIATRPLVLRDTSGSPFYYFHDGNKNVVGLTDATSFHALHYDYSPYGTLSLLPASTLPLDNPFQFSSEVYDTPLALSYYNYRHYNSKSARWSSRDLLEEYSHLNLYGFLKVTLTNFDFLGLFCASVCPDLCTTGSKILNGNVETQVIPFGISPTADDDLSDLGTLDFIFSLANGAKTTVEVSLKGGVVTGIIIGGSEVGADLALIPGGQDFASAIAKLIERHYGSTAGYVVWTRIEHLNCEEKSCCIICERNEYVLKKTPWKRCYPRNSLPNGVLESFYDAQKKIPECREMHKDELRSSR